MTPDSLLSIRALPATFRAKAAEFRAHAAEAQAVTYERAAADVEAAIAADMGALLTLAEAAPASGYSQDHLRHLIASGAIPNAGKRGAPRVRVRDLPRKASGARPAAGYDPDADALSIHTKRGTAA